MAGGAWSVTPVTRLLADLADATGLTSAFSEALGWLRQRRSGHDPGRVAVDLAVMLADGGEAIADLAVLRDQAALFGPVASDPTAWRVLSGIDDAALARLRAARAAGAGAGLGADARDPRRAAGLDGGRAAGPRAGAGRGRHDRDLPLGEGSRRPGPGRRRSATTRCSASSTAPAKPCPACCARAAPGRTPTADHITVLDQALAQIPDAHRHGTPILIRSDSAGCTHGFLAHIRGLREHGVDTRFSVGVAITEPVRRSDPAAASAGSAPSTPTATCATARRSARSPACYPPTVRRYPAGTRFIVRRERPHPGAQLSLFDTIEGMRHQVIATDTPPGGGSIQFLEARHRAHARVEDRIRTGKDTGFGRFPSRVFAINHAWLELALTGIDLLAWTQHLLLDGDLAAAEPKKLRYRLLHVAARITRTARRTRLRIAEGWPWAADLTSAFHRLAALPRPIT